MRSQRSGRQVEELAKFTHRQPAGADLDKVAEGRQPRFVTEGIEDQNC